MWWGCQVVPRLLGQHAGAGQPQPRRAPCTHHTPAHTSLGSVGGHAHLSLLLPARRPLVVILLLSSWWWWLLQVSVDMSIVYDLTHDEQPLAHASTTPTLPVAMTYHTPEEECGTDHTHTDR